MNGVRRSGRESFVAVMETTDLWESDDPARARRLPFGLSILMIYRKGPAA